MAKMRVISTVEDFLEVLAQSGIATEQQLEEVQVAVGEQDLTTPKQLARFLIEREIVTKWQARRLLGGITQFRIGNYILEDQLAATEVGRIFLGHHESLRRAVAIKAFHRELTQDAQTAQQLLEECRKAAALDHRNLIHIFDVDEDRGRVFQVMEYVPADHVGKLVKERGRLEIMQAVELLQQVASGLGHLHEQGLIHGDMKPENVLVDDELRIRLVGLGGRNLRNRGNGEEKVGLVEPASAEGNQGDVPTAWHGCYASPEELAGEQPTTRSDVYSLGCIAYFLLTGTSPHDVDPSVAEPSDPPPLTQMRPEVPRALLRIVSRMIARRPAERYRDASIVVEVLNDLHATLEDSPSFIASQQVPAAPHHRSSPNSQHAAPGDGQQSNSHAGLWIAVCCAVVLVLGGGGIGAWYVFGPRGRQVAALADAARDTSGARSASEPSSDDETKATTDDVEPDSGEAKSGEPSNGEHASGDSELPGLPDLPVAGQGAPNANQPGTKGGDEEKNVKPQPLKDKPTGAGTATAPPPDNPEPEKTPKPEPKPAKGADTKKKAPNKKKAKPRAADVDPFAKLPASVAIPLPTDDQQIVEIGPVPLGDRDLIFLRLLGGSQAVKGNASFEVGAAQGGLASREWTVSLVDGAEKTSIGTFDIVDGKLRFHWEPAARELRVASGFVNTLLTLTTKGKVHKLALRTPVSAPPLQVDLSRNSTTERWKIPALPDPVVVFCEVAKLSEGFPKAAFDPGRQIPLARKSLRIRLGDKPEDSLFFLELSIKPARTNIAATLTPYFQVQPGAPAVRITSKDVAGLLRQAQQTQQTLTAQIAQIKQLQKTAKTKGTKRDQAQLAQNLNLAEQALQRTANQLTALNKLNDLQMSLGEHASIELRFYARVGEDQITLLQTDAPLEAP